MIFKIVGIVLSIIILSKGYSSLPACDYKTAAQAIPPRIFAEQTIDGPQNTYVTRFLHNKVGIYISELAKCYFNIFDPVFIHRSITLVGLTFWMYALYLLVSSKKYPQIAVFLLVPLSAFLKFPLIFIVFFHKIFAIIGMLHFFKMKGLFK